MKHMDVRNEFSNQSHRRRRPPWLRRRLYKALQTQGMEVPHETQVLIDEMRERWWGRFESIPIRNGSPRLNGKSKTYYRARSGRPDSSAKRIFTSDRPRLHRQHYRLLAWCRRKRKGVIKFIEFADGLPTNWELA